MINENSNRNNDPQFIDLKLACRNKDTEDIKRILEEQPNLINEIVDDFFGMTVLLLACVYDWDDIFKYLVTNSNSDTINLQDKNGRTALYFAVNKGKFKHVKLLLSRASINVNIPCGGFDKPVLWYCKNRQCFELLLPHYPDLDEHGKKMALLWYLCRYGTGRVTEVQELMDAVGNDILSKMSHDVSVMVFLAAAGGNADIIQYLLSSYDKLIDINIQDKDGQTPLYEAVKAGSLACVKLLLVHPKIDAIINYEYQLSCALFLAVWNFNAECVKTLLEHPNIKVNEIENVNKRDTPLSQAVFSGSVDCVKELLSHPNIDVNMLYGDEFDKPVLWNCRTRECYDLLLPHYVTLSEDEKTMAWIWNSVFTINYEEDDPKELKTLMKKLSLHALQNMKQDVSELVLLSASSEKPKTLKYLVKRYRDIIDINIKDKNGNTPLYQAVRYQQIESLGILLSDSKIDLNILCGEFDKPVLWYCWDRGTYNLLLPRYPTINKFEKTMTQLWYLCRDYNQPGLMEIQRLIASIPPNILSEMRNDVSVMVLIAATAGKVDIIKYLLSSYGDVIDVNIQDKSGRTSLHRAILSNSKDCISTLVEVVDGTIQDKNGKTARELEDISTSTENSLSLSVNQPYVKWNRFKIMLVGQGRAGKTALANNLAGKWKGETTSTIGAEQMDMQLFYGGVEGGILQKYEKPEHEFESFLAEQYHRDKSRVNNRVTSYRDRSNSAEVSLSHRGPTIKKGITSQTDIESTRSTSLNVHDINLHAVDSHYRTLQEIDTSSSYKLILVDFGGQSIFNVLHAFFMSKHGIYLVVFDMTLFLSKHKEKQEICRKELKFWLKSITMYTSVSSTQKTAPLAIVGTRGDKVRKKKYHQISQELEEMFGEMKVWQSLMWYERDDERLCFFPNDNTKTQNNIVSHQLLLRIEQSLGEITGEKEEIDVIWIKVFDEMKRFHKVYVPFEQVVNIAQQKLGRREREGDMKVKGLHANKPENVEKDRIKEEVRKMLRFLNDIGMILWIEEKGLDDDIILDPIEYLVKPATTIICKHLATKDDPYQTIHEIPEIHQACKLAHKEDWMRMLESGLVSDELARDILMKYYHHKNRLQKNPLSSNVLETSVQYNLEKVLPMMIKFGLMVPLFSPSIPIIPPNKKLYFIPSLLPADPLLLGMRRDRNHEKLLKVLQKRHKKMEENWNIGMCYSLFCFLPMQGLSIAKTSSCDVISSAELSRQGFLPSSLFERLLCRYMQKIDLHRDVTAMDQLLIDNELITGFRGKVQLSHKRHRFRMLERREENRIEVMIQSYDVNNCLSSTDKEEEKEIFQEIHRMTVEIIESLLRECYEGLLVKTLLPLPSQSSAANIQGFVTLRRVRSLLSTSDPFEDVKTYDLNSNDMECEITLQAGEMKKDPYWSVWREKVKIATLPFHSSSPSPSPPLPLTAGKKTHVFLSHDWGIDGNNHNRVKQVSEALKSRGLITWIDDERIVNEIDEKIIDGLNQTMGLAVFVTENYVKKLNSGNHQDYCKKEFHYGIKKLTPEKMIFIVLDKAMKDQNKWSDSMTFNLPSSILYFDLSEIFEQSSNLSEKSVKEKMDNLCQKIATVVELESVSKENDQKSDEVSADNDQGGLLTVKSFCFCCVILFVMTFLIYSVLRV